MVFARCNALVVCTMHVTTCAGLHFTANKERVGKMYDYYVTGVAKYVRVSMDLYSDRS